MAENIRIIPAEQIKLGAGIEGGETAGCEFAASFAGQQFFEPIAQGMKMQNVGSGIGKLFLGQFLGPPIGGLLLLLSPANFEPRRNPRGTLA